MLEHTETVTQYLPEVTINSPIPEPHTQSTAISITTTNTMDVVTPTQNQSALLYQLSSRKKTNSPNLTSSTTPLTSNMESQSQSDTTMSDRVLSNSSFRLLIVGDWGGVIDAPYTSQIQIKVAKAMENVAKMRNVHAVISTGDNFYTRGVKSVNDPRFQVKLIL